MSIGNTISADFQEIIRQGFDPVDVRNALVERRQVLFDRVKENLEEFETHVVNDKTTYKGDGLYRGVCSGAYPMDTHPMGSYVQLANVQAAIMVLDDKRFMSDGTCANPAPIKMNPTKDLASEVRAVMKGEPSLNQFIRERDRKKRMVQDTLSKIAPENN